MGTGVVAATGVVEAAAGPVTAATGVADLVAAAVAAAVNGVIGIGVVVTCVRTGSSRRRPEDAAPEFCRTLAETAII
jgi:hypothetical protein